MKSRDRRSALDLERDLPTTAEDVAALRRAKTILRLDLEGYLHFLRQVPAPAASSLRTKRGPRGDRPFGLVD